MRSVSAASPAAPVSWRPLVGGRGLIAAVLIIGLVAACSPAAGSNKGATGAASGSGSAGVTSDLSDTSLLAQGPAPSSARVLFVPGDSQAAVTPDTRFRVVAAGGTLTRVSVVDNNGVALAGALSPDRVSWQAAGAVLPFGAQYQASATAVDGRGLSTTSVASFQVRAAKVVRASVSPAQNATVGVGMPVIVRLSRAPSDRAAVERALSVTSTPVVTGSWGWVSATEVHWRPRTYWPAGTDVTVRASLSGLRIGNDQTGQGTVVRNFSVGRRTVVTVGIDTHRLKVVTDGAVVRDIPITTGKVGFPTRTGTKVVMGKERFRIMDSTTVDIPANSSDAYRLKVEYAMRLTNSGEFLHAAPWSVGSQGRANVSHGCTGMSMSNARWLFSYLKVGDPVQYSGGSKPMTLTNGWGDWNLSWNAWSARSALT